VTDFKIPHHLREKAWDAVAEVRDSAPRVSDDADSYDVVDAALAVAPLIVASAARVKAEEYRQRIVNEDLDATEVALLHVRIGALESLAAEHES
jgi:hypothetical protein